MSVERKNPLKRDQALNDATSGQIGEEPRSAPEEQTSNLTNERMKTARKGICRITRPLVQRFSNQVPGSVVDLDRKTYHILLVGLT